MFKVSHLSSACILIRTENVNIICDPVSNNPHYGGWLLYPRLGLHILDDFAIDYIYVSHIHQDHYDPDFIKEIQRKNMDLYGKSSEVIVSKRSNRNFLSLKMRKDGIEHRAIDAIKFKGGVEVLIAEFDSGSQTDIDSVLLVRKGGLSVLNINDVVLDMEALQKIQSRLALKNISLLATSYAGAGGYPQCYYGNTEELKEKASQKERYNRAKYKKIIEFFKPEKVLPFAGEHFLTGSSFFINDYRGMYDRYDTQDICCTSVPLNTFRYNEIDLVSGEVIGRLMQRECTLKEYQYFRVKAKDTSWDTPTNALDIEGVHKLCKEAEGAFSKRIERMNIPPYTFIFRDQEEETIVFILEIVGGSCSNYSELTVRRDLLVDAVTKRKHWDNMLGGSLIRIRRTGSHVVGYQCERLLSFFHL